MKQLWWGIALLIILLAGSIFLGNRLAESGEQPLRDLDRAASAAAEGSWGKASALVLRAEKHWHSHRKLAAVLSSHDPLEQVDAAFAQLNTYAAAKDPVQFRALCAVLGQELTALYQSGLFRWWNLL